MKFIIEDAKVVKVTLKYALSGAVCLCLNGVTILKLQDDGKIHKIFVPPEARIDLFNNFDIPFTDSGCVEIEG